MFIIPTPPPPQANQDYIYVHENEKYVQETEEGLGHATNYEVPTSNQVPT